MALPYGASSISSSRAIPPMRPRWDLSGSVEWERDNLKKNERRQRKRGLVVPALVLKRYERVRAVSRVRFSISSLCSADG